MNRDGETPLSLAYGGQKGTPNCLELVGLLARRGANVADHEKQLRSVFGDYNTEKILNDDALIGRLSKIITLDVAKEVGADEGVFHKMSLIFIMAMMYAVLRYLFPRLFHIFYCVCFSVYR